MRSLSLLVGQNLRRNRKNFAFSAVGIVVGISSFVFFIALGTGIKQVVTTEIFPIEANRLQVVPRTSQFGSLQGGRILDDSAIAELEKLPGVKRVYPRLRLQFLASSAFDGRRLSETTLALLVKLPGIRPEMVAALRDVRMWLEIMGTGADPALVAEDAVAGSFTDPPEGAPIPVLLSSRMIEIYNQSFAPARQLPRIDERILPFMPPLPLTLNHSFISRGRAQGPSVETQMKVVGLSRHAIMGGITIPLETARRLNRQFAGPQAATLYEAAVVELQSSDQLGPAQEAVASLGFDIDLGERRMAESVGLAVTLVTLGFTLISLLIVCIAAVNIAHTFFMIIYERRRELGLLRALGASRSDVRTMILGEALLIGLTGGVLGLLVGVGACLASDAILVGVLPDFPFKPESFFAYRWWLFAGAIACAVVFCWLGALLPSRRAARMDPVAALTGR